MRYKKVKIVLLFWCLFIGIGALAGSVGMLSAPDGSVIEMDSLLPYFQVLPFAEVLFQDFVFSGISLLLINGIPNLIAAYLIIKDKKCGVVLGGILGITLMLWICIQFVIFPPNIMDTLYFIFGLLQMITGYACYVFYTQEHFDFDISSFERYPTSKTLVVYFSRMGYVKRIAYGIAQENKAVVLELTTSERTEGTLGFWWCGRFGMHRWPMKVNETDINMEKYDRVIIVSPIWVFSICAPIRAFASFYSGKIKAAEYVFVHFNHSITYFNQADELDALLDLKASRVESICSQIGKIRYRKFADR